MPQPQPTLVRGILGKQDTVPQLLLYLVAMNLPTWPHPNRKSCQTKMPSSMSEMLDDIQREASVAYHHKCHKRHRAHKSLLPIHESYSDYHRRATEAMLDNVQEIFCNRSEILRNSRANTNVVKNESAGIQLEPVRGGGEKLSHSSHQLEGLPPANILAPLTSK